MYFFELKSFLPHLKFFDLIDPSLLDTIVNFYPGHGCFFELNNGQKRYFENVKYEWYVENKKYNHVCIMGSEGGFSTWEDIYSYLFPGYEFKLNYFYPDEKEDYTYPNIVLGIGENKRKEYIIVLCEKDIFPELRTNLTFYQNHTTISGSYPFDNYYYINNLNFICKSAYSSDNPKEDLKLLCNYDNIEIIWGRLNLDIYEMDGYYGDIMNVLLRYGEKIQNLISEL